jgi:hypothetical protein
MSKSKPATTQQFASEHSVFMPVLALMLMSSSLAARKVSPASMELAMSASPSANMMSKLLASVRMWLSKKTPSQSSDNTTFIPNQVLGGCTGFVQILADKHGNWCKSGSLKKQYFVAQFVAVIRL